ncbi:MAG: hypothetical protein QOH72_260 [Solirubrobacteraceae bacterium]|jgi:hypothetical protein|nr:hypothetical protein [Solirubrobacteraceae bacterium]
MEIRKIAVVAASLAAVGATSAVATAAPPAAAPAPVTQAATRQFEGTIVSVNPGARTFRLRDVQRGTVTIKVTSATRYERVSGFAGLRAGMTRMEANVRRSGGGWVATFVHRSGGGGRHGGGAEDR